MITIDLFLFIFIIISCVFIGFMIGLLKGSLELLEHVKIETEEYKRRERAEQLKSMKNETEIRYLNNGGYDDLEYLEKLQKQRIEKAREIVEKED